MSAQNFEESAADAAGATNTSDVMPSIAIAISAATRFPALFTRAVTSPSGVGSLIPDATGGPQSAVTRDFARVVDEGDGRAAG